MQGFLRIFLAIIRTMRPRQWTKNLLFVFPAIVFDGQLFVVPSLLRVVVSFILLCMISGTVYIINDLVDIESDRQHPRKRKRPLPSGELPVRVAIAAAVVIPIVSLAFAAWFSTPLAVILVIYLVMQILYSFVLKHVVIIDVLTITAGFVLRVAAGVVVIEVQNFSPWLYACTGLLALFLAVGKRRQELLLLAENASNVRPIFREYNLPLIDDMMRVVTTSTLITYILYTIETEAPLLQGTSMGLLTVPFVLYGLFRYLYLIHVRGEGSAPEEVLLKDRALQVNIVFFAATWLIILYVVAR